MMSEELSGQHFNVVYGDCSRTTWAGVRVCMPGVCTGVCLAVQRQPVNLVRVPGKRIDIPILYSCTDIPFLYQFSSTYINGLISKGACDILYSFQAYSRASSSQA